MSKEVLDLFFERSPEPMAFADPDGKLTLVNTCFSKLTGHPLSRLRDKHLSFLLHKNCRDTLQAELSAAAKKRRGGIHVPLGRSLKKGKPAFLLITPLKKKSRTEAFFITVSESAPGNRTTRKCSVEKELQRSEQRLRESQKIAKIGNWEWDIKTGELYWSDEIFRIFGQKRGRFKASYPAFLNMIHPDDRDTVEKHVQRALEEKENYNVTHRIVLPDGTIRHVREIGQAVFRANGTAVRMIGTVQDITELARYEEALLDSKRTYQSLFENALVGIFSADLRTSRPIAVNTTCSRLFGYPDTSLFLAEFTPSEHYADPAQQEEHAGTLQQEGQIDNAVVKFRKRNGELFWGHLSVMVITGTTQIQGVVVDVTERVNYEKLLRKSIQEKDLLLKEIHHRVKNNLQVITGLLQLQASKFDDALIQAPLLESVERIRSISMVHERLYRGTEFAEIDFSGYLKDLSASIIEMRAENKIELAFSGDKVRLDIARAVPLGLIFNELITNSLKHAFPGGATGLIRFSISCREQELIITMTENGAGFETASMTDASNLGWKLVDALVRQIKGSIRLTSNPGEGTSITVAIPLANHEYAIA